MEIRSVSRDLWGVFKQYHYLTSSIPSNAKCFVGFIEKEPIAFVAISKFPHPTNKNLYKISRVVTLPHWQGYKIGMKMVENIIEKEYENYDVRLTTTLPIIHSYLWKNDKKWILKFQGIRKNEDSGKHASMSKKIREVYLETYQFNNKMVENHNVNRVRCPINKIKMR